MFHEPDARARLLARYRELSEAVIDDDNGDVPLTRMERRIVEDQLDQQLRVWARWNGLSPIDAEIDLIERTAR